MSTTARVLPASALDTDHTMRLCWSAEPGGNCGYAFAAALETARAAITPLPKAARFAAIEAAMVVLSALASLSTFRKAATSVCRVRSSSACVRVTIF